ncbi:MAG: DNA modification methyltransferase [Fimbriimonadales bacterium]|nr:MAG: DNA modification methyltransferase [Fimbriimonadales bacterium]
MSRQLHLWESDRLSVPAIGQREVLEQLYTPLMCERPELADSVSYSANKGVPLLRLYRYKEAFSYTFVRDIVCAHQNSGDTVVLDPFCGMGTTLLASTLLGAPSWGVDRLPIGVFVANTLLKMLEIPPGAIRETYHQLLAWVPQMSDAPIADDVAIMKVAFDPETLTRLRQWKSAVLQLPSPLREVMMLLLLSVLEPCSYTSKDGQFLRLNRNKQPLFPDTALWERVCLAERDLEIVQMLEWRLQAPATALLGDARNLPHAPIPEKPNLIITSPPYANRYDYTRSYSLELCFFFVNNFEELRQLRREVLRSHIEVKLAPHESPPHPAVQELVSLLTTRRSQLNNPRIPDMITAYFIDMDRAIQEMTRVCAENATVYMVVDNVRFEGELLPVDLILCDLAQRHGFEIEAIWVARYKGNSSQQMGRYGRVPVRESVMVWRKPYG